MVRFSISLGVPVSIREMIQKKFVLYRFRESPVWASTISSRGKHVLYANISKAKQMLQWEPTISLDKGLQETRDYFV